jgi:hypothetical protein
MSYLKFEGGKQENITFQENIMRFISSFTSHSKNPIPFTVAAITGKNGGNQNITAQYELQITSITREDGSGTSFLFNATGKCILQGSEVPIVGEIEGYLKF